MTIEEIIGRFPNLGSVVDETWMRREAVPVEALINPRLPWFDQLEKDLSLLETRVGHQKLIACYRAPLRDRPQIQKAIFEIHGAALLASIATEVALHVPRLGGSAKNFDVGVEILGSKINVEAKTRKDEFPFNFPGKSRGAAGTMEHFGVRATVDPHDAAELGIATTQQHPGGDFVPTPESTVIRQILQDGLSQLPEQGCKLILFGHIDGDRNNLERALFGEEIMHLYRNHGTGEVKSKWDLTPTGAFGGGQEGDPFRSLSGVLWIRLWKHGSEIGHAYKLYPNPNALSPFASKLTEAIETQMKQWETCSQESET